MRHMSWRFERLSLAKDLVTSDRFVRRYGAVYYRGKIFVLGGEGTNRVFGQDEAYDPQKDAWEQYAPLPTPRHGLGAVAIGEAIYVAGGGPIVGGSVQSAVHEALTLG